MQYKRLKELRTKYGYTQEKVAKYSIKKHTPAMN